MKKISNLPPLTTRSELSRKCFALLQAALWKRPADPWLFNEKTDWESIFALAEKQTIVALAYDAALTLPATLQPPTAILRKVHLQATRTAQKHLLLNSRLVEITARLRAEGIHPVLLKGQGVATNYPNPLRRACGDIDLYIGEPDYERCCRLIYQWGMLDDHATESIQHLHFSWQGVYIELHRIAGVVYHPGRNRDFRRWSDALLQGDTCRTMHLSGEAAVGAGITLPPVRFDALYIFYHTYKHFLTGGIGLRQLCDWTMYLHAHCDEIDHPVLLDDLQRFGLLRTWQVMGRIAVDHLGLPGEEFPFYDVQDDPRGEVAAKYARTADKMVEMILSEGNFGFYSPARTTRPVGYVAGKWHSFYSAQRRLREIYQLCPSDVRNYFFYFLVGGIGRLFTDKLITKKITGITK